MANSEVASCKCGPNCRCGTTCKCEKRMAQTSCPCEVGSTKGGACSNKQPTAAASGHPATAAKSSTSSCKNGEAAAGKCSSGHCNYNSKPNVFSRTWSKLTGGSKKDASQKCDSATGACKKGETAQHCDASSASGACKKGAASQHCDSTATTACKSNEQHSCKSAESGCKRECAATCEKCKSPKTACKCVAK